MKRTLALVLSAVLLVPCQAFSDSRGEKISARMEESTVLLRMKVKATFEDPKTGEKIVKSGWGQCSGVYIKENIILSAAHCVEVGENMELKEIWARKGDKSSKVAVVKVDRAADLVLLYTTMSGRPLNFATKVTRGQDCWVIGNPLGLVDVLTKGIVSKLNFTDKREKASFTIIDAAVLPGNSGGAVVDEDYNIIGILTRSTSMFGAFGAVGLGLAVDLKTIQEFLKS